MIDTIKKFCLKNINKPHFHFIFFLKALLSPNIKWYIQSGKAQPNNEVFKSNFIMVYIKYKFLTFCDAYNKTP